MKSSTYNFIAPKTEKTEIKQLKKEVKKGVPQETLTKNSISCFQSYSETLILYSDDNALNSHLCLNCI